MPRIAMAAGVATWKATDGLGWPGGGSGVPSTSTLLALRLPLKGSGCMKPTSAAPGTAASSASIRS